MSVQPKQEEEKWWDPLCVCGHPKSEHMKVHYDPPKRGVTGWGRCLVKGCGCGVFRLQEDGVGS